VVEGLGEVQVDVEVDGGRLRAAMEEEQAMAAVLDAMEGEEQA
jgi:hypothetical protein